MNKYIPKFHSRTSLLIGIIASFSLSAISIYDMVCDFKIYRLFPFMIGIVLGIHCLDMIFYYKKHRIIKIEKSDTERIITKENDKTK